MPALAAHRSTPASRGAPSRRAACDQEARVVALGEVGAEVARRGSPRGRARSRPWPAPRRPGCRASAAARSRGAAGAPGRRAAGRRGTAAPGPRRRARGRGPSQVAAPRMSARSARRGRVRGRARVAAALPRAAGAVSPTIASGGAGAEHEPSEQRVAGQAVGAVHARARAPRPRRRAPGSVARPCRSVATPPIT